jgi:catechol 2,3-dioxygenase-like lactoylglutathione lyase family enzyme
MDRPVSDGGRRLHHAGLTVSDLSRSLAFWRDALGMGEVLAQEARGGYFEAIVGEQSVDVAMVHLAFADGGPRVELFEFRSPRGGVHRSRPADVGFAHVCVAVPAADDLGALVARLLDAGGSLVGPVVEIDAGANRGGRACYVRDPDGHVLELFAPPPVPAAGAGA